jgi:PhnB protein
LFEANRILGFLPENENRSKIIIRAESKKEGDNSYNEPAAGAKRELPKSDGPWGPVWRCPGTNMVCSG